jgi:hypothetical protein
MSGGPPAFRVRRESWAILSGNDPPTGSRSPWLGPLRAALRHLCCSPVLCRSGFRSGLNAPPYGRRSPTLQPPRKIPQTKAQLPGKWSTFSPPQWSSFTPPLTLVPGSGRWLAPRRPAWAGALAAAAGSRVALRTAASSALSREPARTAGPPRVRLSCRRPPLADPRIQLVGNVRWNQSPGGLVLLRQSRRSRGVYWSIFTPALITTANRLSSPRQ